MSKKEIQQKIHDCVKRMPHGQDIKKVLLFGSHVHGTARPDSDIDLLVDFDETARIGLFDLVRMQDTFAEGLGAQVDLGTPDSLSKYIRDRVLTEAETVYER